MVTTISTYVKPLRHLRV